MSNVTACSGGTVASPVKSETLPEIMEVTSAILSDTEGVLRRILEVLENGVNDGGCDNKRSICCFRDGVSVTRSQAEQVFSLSRTILSSFQA